MEREEEESDQNLPNGGTPFGSDRYAATAAAVAAGAGSMLHGVPPKHAQLSGVQQQEWQQPRSPASTDGQQIPHHPQHPYAGAYPPQFMQGRPPGFPCYPPGYPGVPPGQPSYPGGVPTPVGYPPHMMRPQQPELVRMPQGPTPSEWAAQQQQRALKEGNPATPASIPAPSPAASSVGPPTAANPPRVMPERRMFFERLVQFCEQHGEPITMIPQVSKQNVDLHRLYIGVRNRGGFEQVTKDKAWKTICTEANPEISQSSAAGYQLRKHYEKHLLLLECVETGRRPEDAVAFADGLKRQRRKEPAAAAAPGTTPAAPLPPFPGT
ncbi:unnamed protein product [Nippostrongylus brasiliensis]|uniref:Trithorax group protein osa (inferred by orthology to a D. melanogaster protein) n=1 Tax=Nippostrongylus brasiliensis TaxID=27835 RepID=A0A0N4YU95_NIPBR|nr:unnamed protein product [Nippostrongylus brasiliensis]